MNLYMKMNYKGIEGFQGGAWNVVGGGEKNVGTFHSEVNGEFGWESNH